MGLFRFEALNESGKKYSGTIDADNLQDAKFKLLRREILVTNIVSLSGKQLNCHLPKKEILNLTREIARLLQAGLPLFEVLVALEEKYKNQKAHPLLLDLCDQVKSGKPLSESLSRHSQSFDLLYVSMVSNAEKTGRLRESLEEIASWISKELQVRKQLISALLYPALLGTFCLFVLSALLFFVIPSMAELFEGRELHPMTKIVFAVSRWACSAKPLIAVSGVAFTGLISLSIFYLPWRARIGSLALRLPFLKVLLTKVAFVRFCRSCGTLLEGGLPIITALHQARSTMRHAILEKVVAKAEEGMKQGEKLYRSFQNHPFIPPLVPRMLGIAEEGGKLPYMMRQIAEIYEDDLEKNLSYISTVAQPLLLLLLGGMVGLVLLSVLLPLTDVSSFAN
ncbi:MAG: type II secretion system F family protein [Verrucomicrobia bacterium]|nr:type II secretion system F family protein [Verrucomicrobiota bacterium]